MDTPEPGTIASTGFAVLRPMSRVDSKFLYYAVRATQFIEEVVARSVGASYPAISPQVLGRLPLWVPPLSEQRTIADYLDRETARIDALVAKKRRLMELLREHIHTKVFQAVTQGVVDGEPLAPTGVQAFPYAPARWKVLPLRRLGVIVQTGPFGSALHAEDYVPGAFPVVNPANILGDRIIPNWDVTVDAQTRARLSEYELRAGDIVFGRRGELGRAALVTPAEDGWLCGTGCLRVRFKTAVLEPGYLQHFLRSATKQYFEAYAIGITMGNLNSAILLALPVILPPHQEQQAIAHYCDRVLAQLDHSVRVISEQVDLIIERRQTLITAAVTGQLDISQVAA